jgi:DNA invertase Pin-like site-specific DNA recombinase
MFQILGVFAEFERSIIVERVRSGMARAKAQGTRSGKAISRPQVSRAVEAEIRERLNSGVGVLKTARILRVGSSVVQRVRREMSAAATRACRQLRQGST